MGSTDLLTVQAGTRAQAPPVLLAERHGRRGSRATWLPTLPLPVAVPTLQPVHESPAPDLPWRLATGDCLMGVQLGLMGVQLGLMEFNSASWSSGLACETAAAVRELPGQQRRLSLCSPDD